MFVKEKFCKTKIMCTLGPSCDNEETLRSLLKEGLDGVRFNFSLGTHEENLTRIERFRKVEKEFGIKIPMILDTKGPKIRLGDFKESVLLTEGQKYILTINDVIGDEKKASVSYKGLVKDLKPGDKVSIDDGLIELKVDNITDSDVNCTVLNTGKIGSKKGVNLPGVKISLPTFSKKDIEDLKFAVDNKFDFVAASFVRTKQDCLDVKKYLKDFGGENIQVIAKIENQEGLDNFDEILPLVEGIMVARGDLGAEIPIEKLPFEQKKMLKKCLANGKLTIIAAQMLDSMMVNPRPSRAEVTDISNAIIDGSSVIMLSGETANGKHPIEALKFMNIIAREAENHLNLLELSCSLGEFENLANSNPELYYKRVIEYSSCVTANLLNAKAIICLTRNGITPNILSGYRPKSPIFAITTNELVARQLALVWNVNPIFFNEFTDPQDMVDKSVKKLKDIQILNSGDTVVIAGGDVEDKNGKYTATISFVMKVN